MGSLICHSEQVWVQRGDIEPLSGDERRGRGVERKEGRKGRRGDWVIDRSGLV